MSEKERRSTSPGRRDSDRHICPLHESHTKCLETLKTRVNRRVTQHEFDHLEEEVESKLDKWIFILFVTSISIFITISAGAFGWVAIETVKSQKEVAILTANQVKMMEHFDLKPIDNSKDAEKVLNEQVN